MRLRRSIQRTLNERKKHVPFLNVHMKFKNNGPRRTEKFLTYALDCAIYTRNLGMREVLRYSEIIFNYSYRLILKISMWVWHEASTYSKRGASVDYCDGGVLCALVCELASHLCSKHSSRSISTYFSIVCHGFVSIYSNCTRALSAVSWTASANSRRIFARFLPER